MRQFFSTTLGQILAIIATSSAITFLLFLLILWLLPGGPPPPPWPWQPAYRIASFVEGIRAVPEGATADIIAAARGSALFITVTQAPSPCETLTTETRDLETALRFELGAVTSDISVHACETKDAARAVQALIGLGERTLDIRLGRYAPGPTRFTFPFVAALVFLCVAVTTMSAWAIWRVIGPLRRLSEKAEAFGQDIAVAPIAEEGPLEIRRAAHAFNLMQKRIAQSIRDRTRMLAAVSHDLRSPLTRMRLQLETHQVKDVREKLLRDIRLMQSMVTSALVFLSRGFEDEEKEWLDLGALLESLSDEYQEAGARVRYDGNRKIEFFCRPNAINRALTNLIDNGIHFGDEVTISALVAEQMILLEISDNGPGIPAAQMQEVVEPFVRLDPSRPSRAGSVGLGLAIVKEIIEAHQGTLTLEERKPRGLTVRIQLPAPASKTVT